MQISKPTVPKIKAVVLNEVSKSCIFAGWTRISKDYLRWHHVEILFWVVNGSEKNRLVTTWWSDVSIYALIVFEIQWSQSSIYMQFSKLTVPKNKAVVLNMKEGNFLPPVFWILVSQSSGYGKKEKQAPLKVCDDGGENNLLGRNYVA